MIKPKVGFVPSKPAFLFDKKRTSLPILSDLDRLQHQLLDSFQSSFPDIKSNLPSMRSEDPNQEGDFPESRNSYQLLTERAKDHVSKMEKLFLTQVRKIPSRRESVKKERHLVLREKIEEANAFVTATKIVDFEEQEKQEEYDRLFKAPVYRLKNKILQSVPIPDNSSNKSILTVNELLRIKWDVGGLKKSIDQAKDSISQYGAELVEMRDQLRAINRVKKEKTERGLNENLIVKMEGTFRRMEEETEFKFGKARHMSTEAFERLAKYHPIDPVTMKRNKLGLPTLIVKPRMSPIKAFAHSDRFAPSVATKSEIKEMKIKTIRGKLRNNVDDV